MSGLLCRDLRLLLLLLLLLLGACQKSEAKPVEARPVAGSVSAAAERRERGAIEDSVLLSGELAASAAVNLSVPRTPIWTLSVSWLAEDGAVVKKGDRIVEFDAAALHGDLETQRNAVRRAERELASQEAKSLATVAEKGLAVERKRAELGRAELAASVQADLVPLREHQEKQLALAQARAALTQAQDELLVQQRVGGLERTLKEQARARAQRELADLSRQLEELSLRAPRDGIVQIALNYSERRRFLPLDIVRPGTVIASLPLAGAMQVDARLSDLDDGAVREGMAAECTLDAFPKRRFRGTVRRVSPVALPEGRDSTRRFFEVIVDLDEVDPELMRPGMSARIEVRRKS